MRRRTRQGLITCILILLAGTRCVDGGVTGPTENSTGARLQLAPSFSTAAAQIFRSLETFGLELDNVRVQVRPLDEDGAAVKDTVILLNGDESEITVDLLVPVSGPEQRMRAHIHLRDGEQVLFSATQDVLLRRGLPTTQPEAVELQYIGPGANATRLVVGPEQASLFANDSVTLTATAFDASEQSVPVSAIAWAITDAARGSVSEAGVFKPSPTRGNALIVGRLPTGLKDTASISVLPVPSQVTLISGGGQSGVVGTTLELPIVVEVRAGDNLPVPGVNVGFAIASGGGSLSTLSAVSDANGRASTAVTLGPLAGAYSVTATIAGAPALTVSATATVGAAAKLAMLQQPAAAATSGMLLATQPRVKLEDAFGNPVATSGVQVLAVASGITGLTLGGTVTATTNASGVASFTDLVLFGPPGTATITFTAGQLASVTSGNLTLAAGVILPWQIGSADTTDKHRLSPGGQERISFKVLDQIGSTVVPNVPVSFQPAGSCTPLQTAATSDAAGIVVVDVSMPTGFTSCTLIATIEQDIPLPGGGTFRPVGLQRLYAVDAAVPLWTGGAQIGGDSWDLKDNWFDSVVPASEPLVFIPGSVAAIPRIDRGMTLQTLVIENFGQVNLNAQSLIIGGDLVGGGLIGNAGTVTFTAGRLGTINGSILGGVTLIGPPSPQCQPGIAYSIVGFASIEALEINCGLAVAGTSVALSVSGDLKVTSPSGGLEVGGGAAVLVHGNALFNLGTSVIQDGSLQVLNSLVVDASATLNQAKGLISVTGDARFDGRSLFTDGVLDLQQNLSHKGNGDNIVFSATFPHRTVLRGTKDPLSISWESQTSIAKFGQLEILNVSPGGYQFSNVAGAPVPVDHLIVGPGAKLTVAPDFTINVGGAKGQGLQIQTGGTLVHNGRLIVIGAIGCLPLPSPFPVPDPYSCLTP